jgi:hypothetical protein
MGAPGALAMYLGDYAVTLNEEIRQAENQLRVSRAELRKKKGH